MLQMAHRLAAVLLVVSCLAPRLARSDEPVVLAQRWTLHSNVLGEDRTISVHLPARYEQSTDRYPVLYVLDGEQLLIPLSGVTETLRWGFRGPDVIVVAIHNVNRNRDFTVPTAGNAGGANAGGADKFLSFLQTELIPQVETRYRASHFRMLFGHSLGGLMALHAFVAAPGLFAATLASSPAIDYNGDYVVERAKALFAAGKGNTGFLFVSMAAREYDDSPRAFRKFEELLRLRAPAGLHWDTRVMPDTDHGTVLLAAAQQGLEFVFPDWRLPTLVFEEGLDSVERFYRDASTRYDMDLLPPARELDALGQRVLKTKDSAEGVRVYRRYADLYPNDVSGRAGLAAAWSAAGKADSARVELKRAIELAKQSNDRREGDLRSELDALGKAGRSGETKRSSR